MTTGRLLGCVAVGEDGVASCGGSFADSPFLSEGDELPQSRERWGAGGVADREMEKVV